MRDVERLLRDALSRAGEGYDPDTYRARAAFAERLRRRRRVVYLRTGGIVAAAAIIAVVLVPGTVTEPERSEFAVAPEVVATIPVGGVPNEAAVAADGSVWVATGDDVVGIDPVVNAVVRSARIGGWSDELVATQDLVWVSTREGHIFLVDAQNGAVVGRTSVPRSQNLDIAARDDSFWAVGTRDGTLYQTSAASDSIEATEDDSAASPGEIEELGGPVLFEQRFEGMPLTDVAAGDAGVWVLYRNEDSAGVFQVDPEELGGESEPIAVEVGENADLAVGLHAVWVATGTNGTVERVDPATGEVTAIVEVGGRQTDLSVGEGVVWAVTGGDGPPRLHQIGADGEFIGEPLELEGDPVDVSVGAGAVWVADKANGGVLRIESDDQAPPVAETPEPTPTRDVVTADVLYVYATGLDSADLYAQTTSDDLKRLTTTPDIEMNPAFAPDGGALVFERDVVDAENAPLPLIHLDLETGEEQVIAEGASHAAFAPDGRLAFFRESTRIGVVEIAIGSVERVGGHASFIEEISLEVASFDGMGARNLHWDDESSTLYFETFRGGWRVNRLDLNEVSDGQEVDPEIITADGMPEGSELTRSAGATEEGLDVLLLCCREDHPDPLQSFSIGRISFTDGGATYTPLVTEMPEGFDVGAQRYTLERLDGWSLGEDGTWERAPDAEGWLLGDGFTAWWIDEDESLPLPGTEAADRLHGLTVNPVAAAE